MFLVVPVTPDVGMADNGVIMVPVTAVIAPISRIAIPVAGIAIGRGVSVTIAVGGVPIAIPVSGIAVAIAVIRITPAIGRRGYRATY